MVPPAATASTPVESLCGGFLQRTNLASCAASRCSRKCISNPGFIYIECAAPLPPPFSPQHRHIPTVSSSSLPVWLPSLGHTRFVSYSASHVNDLNRPPSALFSLPSFRPLFHTKLRPPYWKRRGDQSLLFVSLSGISTMFPMSGTVDVTKRKLPPGVLRIWTLTAPTCGRNSPGRRKTASIIGTWSLQTAWSA